MKDRGSFFIIVVVFLGFWITVEPVHALMCSPFRTSSDTLVVAESTEQELDCENMRLINRFDRLVGVKGDVEKSFEIWSPPKGECPIPIDPNGRMSLAPPDCAGCPPSPTFVKGQIYFMSLYPQYGQNNKVWSLPLCNRVFHEVRGVGDPIIWSTAIQVYTQALWMPGFIITMILALAITSVFEFSSLAIPLIIAGSIVIIIHCLLLYLAITIALSIRTKVRKKKNTSPS